MSSKQKVVLIGASSNLKFELEEYCDVIGFGRNEIEGWDLINNISFCLHQIPIDEIYYCINLGMLIPKFINEINDADEFAALRINMTAPVRLCEFILANNPNSRILIIGSESGEKGSFDTLYFLAKAALSAYVRERKVGVNQQILMLSPSTIGDSNMTSSRKDLDRLKKYKKQHPKKRFLNMSEVALTIDKVFLESTLYLCNEEIRLNGGKFARQ